MADKEKESDDSNAEPAYDFFSRQKEIELGKDFVKLKQTIKFIPEDVGKGGFDEVVYWSQNATTP